MRLEACGHENIVNVVRYIEPDATDHLAKPCNPVLLHRESAL
jgi:hypothetical protein